VQRRPRKPAAVAAPVLEVVPPPAPQPSPEAIARLAVDAAANKKAEDIVLLDIRELTSMADYFVICSASTDRQVKSVVEGIELDLKADGVRPVHVEGEQGSGWVLVDFGDVICHVFKSEERDYYRLEELWTGAKTLVRMQ
jgi:ribosome-associated protein